MNHILATALALTLSVPSLAAQSLSLERPRDPVVLSGQDLPSLAITPADYVVGFRWQASGWSQIPVQVDERIDVEYQQVYGPGFLVNTALRTIAYADPTTLIGADPDPNFDWDDEIVFMASDCGESAVACAAEPPGTLPGSGVEIALTDPLGPATGYVYLFRSDGTLDPSAGQDYVAYDFELLSGPYLPTYQIPEGPNPEDSEVRTGSYRVHFSDRWIRDEIHVDDGGASGVDILDRHKYLHKPGFCGRTETTFSNGEGAFFANRDGPVRAIRSYLGANSGDLTQRDHFFYAGREDVLTYLRVHQLQWGGSDLLDFSPEAVGLVYSNDLNPAGAVIDGVPDSIIPGTLGWELVTGMQGTLMISLRLVTDIPMLIPYSYYSDNVKPTNVQCTGDSFEYGTSGQWLDTALPNTDPRFKPFYSLCQVRTVYYDAPGQNHALAATRANQAATPIVATVLPFIPVPPVVSYCVGKTNSLGCLPQIEAVGAPSSTLASGFEIRGLNVRNHKSGLLFYGTSGRAVVPFQGGVLCVAAPIRRTPVIVSGGNPPPLNDCSGIYSIDMNAFAQGVLGGNPLPALTIAGTVVQCQWWGRDSGFQPPDNTTLTDALEYIVDCDDACPGDPLKVAPGVCGCGVPDTDTDGDGTPDCNDLCPSDPLKIAPGACGCGVPDTDTDGDGTPDCNDLCPSDPLKIAPGACGCGVPDTDTDGDGTPDCNDLCPSDPLKIAPGACGCGVPDTDTDGDGTPDCNDLCPSDPLKIAPGACGCGIPDTDTDGDGTPDCNDLCPSDPLKIAPGACGCGIPDTDTDGDGTPDCNDLCPSDPLKIAPGVCGCGIPDTDSDGDGTPDCNDLCPSDPLKIAPGVCGCGVPDTDTDGDGVPDCLDNCVLVPNPLQEDCDGDGIGDVCAIAGGEPDCNTNGVPDHCDIAQGTSLDLNGNGIPDECEIP